MIAFDVEVDEKALLRATDAARATLVDHVRKGIHRYLLIFGGRVQRERFRGRPGLHSRRGRGGGLLSTMRSLVHGSTLDSLEGTWTIGARSHPYARIHEYGGVILPKKGTRLVFRLQADTTAGGPTGQLGPAVGPGVGRAIFARSVRIPARLGVRELWVRDTEQRAKTLRESMVSALVAAGFQR